jgi:hypothetical protein
MDRRTVVVSLLGLAGAGAAWRWSNGALLGVKRKGQATAALARPASRQRATGGIGTISLAQVPIGGGGFVTGIDASSDGKRLACRTDVANAYIRGVDELAWRPLFSTSTLNESDFDPWPPLNGKADGEGVAGIRIAPSNPNVIFASFHGFIWKSLDGGKTVRRTKLGQKVMLSNAGVQRLFNRCIDIHPQDPDRVIVGTWGDGLWSTTDGGDTWAQAKLAAPRQSSDGHPGLILVAFAPDTPQTVYAFVTGVGLFRSISGCTGEFVSLTGGPTTCSSMVVNSEGTLFLCEHTPSETGGKLWNYSGKSGWKSGQPEHEMFVVAVDPNRPSRLIASNPNGYFVESKDGGSTFRSIGGAGWSGKGEVSWTRGLKTFFPAQLIFDPLTPNQLFVAQGVGVAKLDCAPTPYLATDWSAGIEELCAVTTLCVPGGDTYLSAWDKSFWRVDDLTAYANDFHYPVRPGKPHQADLVAYGSYMDYASNDSRYLVGVVAPSELAAPGYSVDGGETWQAFKGTPASGWGNGGCIACNRKENTILLPSNNGVGVFTLNSGQTWDPIRLDQNNPTSGFANSFYVTRKNITADKMRPLTFALIYTVLIGNDYGNPLGGVWLTRDGGKTWNMALKGVISVGDHDPKAVRAQGREERQFWQCQLEYVPEHAGQLVYSPHADYADDQFFWSKDDGQSWAELHPKIRNVRSFGFGRSMTGQPYQALYFWGEVDHTEGLYASFDWCATPPRLLSRFPSEMLAKVSCVTGDPNVFGRVYIGTSCAGWIRCDIEL